MRKRAEKKGAYLCNWLAEAENVSTSIIDSRPQMVGCDGASHLRLTLAKVRISFCPLEAFIFCVGSFGGDFTVGPHCCTAAKPSRVLICSKMMRNLGNAECNLCS